MRLAASMLMLLASSAAFACDECIGAGPNSQAFFDTMVFLSLAPLAMIFSVVGIVVWKVRNMPDEQPITPPEALETK